MGGSISVDGETGILIPPRDATTLAAAIDRLVADPALRRRMGEAARARVDALQTIFDEMPAFRRASRGG